MPGSDGECRECALGSQHSSERDAGRQGIRNQVRAVEQHVARLAAARRNAAAALHEWMASAGDRGRQGGHVQEYNGRRCSFPAFCASLNHTT